MEVGLLELLYHLPRSEEFWAVVLLGEMGFALDAAMQSLVLFYFLFFGSLISFIGEKTFHKMKFA
jgi:hypothetical protein